MQTDSEETAHELRLAHPKDLLQVSGLTDCLYPIGYPRFTLRSAKSSKHVGSKSSRSQTGKRRVSNGHFHVPQLNFPGS